jgi:hypothetical protein
MLTALFLNPLVISFLIIFVTLKVVGLMVRVKNDIKRYCKEGGVAICTGAVERLGSAGQWLQIGDDAFVAYVR